MSWYLLVLKKYAVFEGRARRKEFWYFTLFNNLIYLGIVLVDTMLGFEPLFYIYGPLATLYIAAIVLPEIAVTVRRLHDTDHSGWWLLVILPAMGIFWAEAGSFGLLVTVIAIVLSLGVLLLLLVRDGDAGLNRFGANPKLEGAPA